jgi:hypothetical protein
MTSVCPAPSQRDAVRRLDHIAGLQQAGPRAAWIDPRDDHAARGAGDSRQGGGERLHIHADVRSRGSRPTEQPVCLSHHRRGRNEPASFAVIDDEPGHRRVGGKKKRARFDAWI